MTKKLYEESNIQSIAAAIREKNGSQNTYTAAQMPNAIRAIVSGEPILQEKTATQNGIVLPDTGYDGLSKVTVNVSGGDATGIVSPLYQGLAYFYVSANGTAIYGTQNKNQSINVFEVVKDHAYTIALGGIVGTRRRATFLANKSFSDIYEYINQQQEEGASLITGGTWLAPINQGEDDSGNNLICRIYFKAPENGLVIYGTGHTGEIVPAHCIETDPISIDTFILRISRALRGDNVLAYAGAHEIRLIYTDQNGQEYDLSTSNVKNVSPSYASRLFDGDLTQYYENNPTPFNIKFMVIHPSDKTYTLKRLEVYRRTGSYNTDVWSSFTLTQNGNLVIERSNLSVDDWASAGSWTSFTVDS